MQGARIPELFCAFAGDGREFPQAAKIHEKFAPEQVIGFLDRMKYKLVPNWRVNGEPICLGVELEKGGSQWPDFLRTSSHGPGWRLLVTERVVATLEKEGYHAFEAKPASFEKIPGKKLQDTPAPRYFGLRAMHELEMETRCYRYEEGELRYQGSYGDHEEKPEWSRFQVGMCRMRKPVAGTLLKPGLFQIYIGAFICRRRIVEIAFRERWSNLEFRALDALVLEGLQLPYCLRVEADKGGMEGPWYTELDGKAG